MNEDYRHSKATSYSKHQIDLQEHKDGGKHIASVRHPFTHEVMHTTDAHDSQDKALLTAKQWIHIKSPLARLSQRGGKLFKAEEDSIQEFMERKK
jgi:hypothetical protein